jgi:hypothetical protein
MSNLASIQQSGGHVDLSSRIEINTTVVASPTGATETAICALTIPHALVTTTGVILLASAAVTVGTSGVSGQLRLYHGTIAGTKVGDSGALTMVAGNLYCPLVFGLDASPVLPNQTYTLSLTVASGAATSTVSQVRLVALII